MVINRRNTSKTIRFLAFALFFIHQTSTLSLAQDVNQILHYQREAGVLSTFMRGALPEAYPYTYNGTPYLESPAYKIGSVLYNGKLYHNVLVNLDANRMDLLVRLSADYSPIATYRDQTAWFTMGTRLFVNLSYMGFENGPQGYFELLHDGEAPVLKLVTKRLRTQAGNFNGGAIGYFDENYLEDVPNYFHREEFIYTIKNNTVQKVSKRELKRLLKKRGGTSPIEERLYTYIGTDKAAKAYNNPIKIGGISLPNDYFSSETKEAGEFSSQEEFITATYRNKIYRIGSGKTEGKAIVRGIVRDLESKEALAGVVVYDEKTSTHTITGSNGEYALPLPTDENVLHFSLDGKEELGLRIIVGGDGRLDVELPEKIELIKASVVSATSMESHRTTTMGIEEVSMKTMSKIPSAFGEGDIIRSVLTLPGVKSTGEASGGFNVRGGSQDQNLILFNGNTIYNPSHLFGLFSAFNPDIIENLELFKSSIPAQYGGRISSVLTVNSRRGNMEEFKGSAGIGLLTSRLHLEGPVVKGKTSFILAGRTSYSDWLLKQLPKNSYYSDGSANFYDINAGLSHWISDKDLLSLNIYTASDKFSFSADTTFNNSNLNASLQFRHREKNGNTIEASAGCDYFQNTTGLYSIESTAAEIRTAIRQAFLKSAITKVFKTNSLKYGLDFVYFCLAPGSRIPYGDNSLVQTMEIPSENGLEPAIYITDNWAISNKLSIEGGLRIAAFLSSKDRAFYAGPEVRLSGRFSPMSNLSVKMGFNTLRQNIHLISNTASISPMDTWKLSDADIAPTTGWQGAGGVYWTSLDTGIDFSAEVYWKQARNQLDYRPGATLVMNENLAEDLLPVQGKSYGVELMMKKSTGRITGWLSYSYARALLKEMQDRGGETIAGGNWYNAPYDKPHELKMAANWAITHRYSLSINLDYSTGRPITVPSGRYYFGGAWRLAYSERNSYRIPDYFRIDAALNIDPGHYLKALAHTSIIIGVYNLTGRHNPYSVFYKTNDAGEIKGYMLSIFATQIPYVNLNILF